MPVVRFTILVAVVVAGGNLIAVTVFGDPEDAMSALLLFAALIGLHGLFDAYRS